VDDVLFEPAFDAAAIENPDPDPDVALNGDTDITLDSDADVALDSDVGINVDAGTEDTFGSDVDDAGSGSDAASDAPGAAGIPVEEKS
jgi:hypothetical protein